MEEADVGITANVSPDVPGFECIIKHRYSDFQVSEIGPDGAVARLTTTEWAPAATAAAAATTACTREAAASTVPAAGGPSEASTAAAAAALPPPTGGPSEPPKQQQQSHEQPTAAAATDAREAALEDFAALAGPENAGRLLSLLAATDTWRAAGTSADASTCPCVTLLPIDSKATRTAVHAFVRTDPRLPPLASDAVDDPAGGAVRAIEVRAAAVRGGGNASSGREPDGSNRGGNKRPREPENGSSSTGAVWREGAAWPGGSERRFVRFVLYKENIETQAALGVISGLLGGRGGGGGRGGRHRGGGRGRGGRGGNSNGTPGFGIAGTKDKRGATAQWATLLRVHPARLAALNSRLRGIKLGDFSFARAGLQLGQLRGNRFALLLREVVAEGGGGGGEAHVEAACRAVRDRGFVNYFGLQRFGTGGAPTHKIGAALLRHDWAGAASLLMAPGPNDWPDVAEARRLFMENGDVEGALARLPQFFVAERALLSALARSQAREAGQTTHNSAGNGCNETSVHTAHPAAAAVPPGFYYAAGLAAVPRTLRMLYLHAWQAALWNAAATARVAAYGADSAVEGDLVLLPAALPAEASSGEAKQNGAEGSTAEPGSNAALDTDGDGVNGDEHGAASRLARVHLVTAADVAAGRFSIADVVLPLPGSQVRYPTHAAAGLEFYKAAAAAAGIDLATGAAVAVSSPPAAAAPTDAGRRLAAEFELRTVTGDYRRLLHVPADLTWRLLRYSAAEADAPLLPTDWDVLQQGREQQQAAAAAVAAVAAPPPPPQQQQEDHSKTGSGSTESFSPRLALHLEFSLPPSGYATMLLRELTKRGTSKAAHKAASLAARSTGEAAAEAAAAGTMAAAAPT